MKNCPFLHVYLEIMQHSTNDCLSSQKCSFRLQINFIIRALITQIVKIFDYAHNAKTITECLCKRSILTFTSQLRTTMIFQVTPEYN